MHEQTHTAGFFQDLTTLFQFNRKRLEGIIRIHSHPLLMKRMALEDILQDVYVACSKRQAYFTDHPEVPPFVKLRTILLQTIVDLERKHLACQKRDVYKEISIDEEHRDPCEQASILCENLLDTVTSPGTKLVKKERNIIVHRVLATLSEKDRMILTMRHLEELTNLECASLLQISPDAASIRYVRALQHFHDVAATYSGLYP